LNEPAAFSPFEAMSSGLPVVVSEKNGTNYIIQHGKTDSLLIPKVKMNIGKALNFL
jgi:glycosyltransferase involved in cell wall biosynthesis